MNLLALERGPDGAVIAGTEGPAVLPADCAHGKLGIRPEHISLGLERGVHATVESVEYLGGDSLLACRIGAQPLAVRVAGSVGLASGDSRLADVGGGRAAFLRGGRSAPRRERAPRRRNACWHESTREESKHMMNRWIRGDSRRMLAAAGLWLVAGAAQAQTEVSFYYPVAVGGPITKIIDGYAADFEKENPGIKLKPIYSGSYQESITKALTAVKSGEPPVMSILLSTDMYTLIDEDAIVPFDPLHQDGGRPGVAEVVLSGVHGEQPDRRQDLGHSVPALDHRAVLQQGDVQGGGARSQQAAGHVDARCASTRRSSPSATRRARSRSGACRFRRRASRTGCSRGSRSRTARNLMNPAGTQTYYDKPEVIGALQYWVDLVNKYKVHPEGIVEWGTTPKDFFEKKVAMIWTTTGNLTNVKNNAKFDFGVAMLPASKQRGSPTGGGNFYIFAKSTPAQREAAMKFIKWVTTPRARGAVGHRHGLRRGARRCVGDAGDEAVRRRAFRRRRSRATSCRTRRRSCRRTTTSA